MSHSIHDIGIQYSNDGSGIISALVLSTKVGLQAGLGQALSSSTGCRVEVPSAKKVRQYPEDQVRQNPDY